MQNDFLNVVPAFILKRKTVPLMIGIYYPSLKEKFINVFTQTCVFALYVIIFIALINQRINDKSRIK